MDANLKRRPGVGATDRRRRGASIALWVVGFLGLLLATAWNLTRSDAIEQARVAYKVGDLPRCLELSLDHLERQPWNRESALLAARCLSRLDYSAEAEDYFRRAGDLSLGDMQIRAYGLARGPHPERSIAAFHEILEKAPDNVTALRRLAAVQLARNQTEELLRLADRLSQLAHGQVIGQTLRGVVFHNDRNEASAVSAFERVLELDPKLEEMPLPRPTFWSYLSDDLIGSGRIDQARRHLLNAVASTPDPGLLIRVGRIYVLQNEPETAARYFEQAASENPGDCEPWIELGKIAIQSKNPERALEYLERARMLAPRHYSILYSLASVYRQLDRGSDAAGVQEVIAQLREASVVSSRGTSQSWPRYTL